MKAEIPPKKNFCLCFLYPCRILRFFDLLFSFHYAEVLFLLLLGWRRHLRRLDFEVSYLLNSIVTFYFFAFLLKRFVHECKI